MSELNLILSSLSGGIENEHEGTDIHVALSKHLLVAPPKFIYHRSADPVPFMQLVGDTASWWPLTVVVTAYFSRLAMHVADATWDKAVSFVKRKDAAPLVDVAKALILAKKEGRKVEIGLNIPDDYFGTTLQIKGSDLADVAQELAVFVVHVEKLSKVMQDEIAAGRGPIGMASIEIQADESICVTWQDCNFDQHEKHIF